MRRAAALLTLALCALPAAPASANADCLREWSDRRPWMTVMPADPLDVVEFEAFRAAALAACVAS